jgi:molybdopterin converting factor subunit 1
MKILYFAWLKTRVGFGEEDVSPPASVRDIAGLVEWLKTQSPGHAEAFAELSVVRAAVDYEYVQSDHPVKPDDEIAFFPPVTGG